jgi:hypothetical protein
MRMQSTRGMGRKKKYIKKESKPKQCLSRTCSFVILFKCTSRDRSPCGAGVGKKRMGGCGGARSNCYVCMYVCMYVCVCMYAMEPCHSSPQYVNLPLPSRVVVVFFPSPSLCSSVLIRCRFSIPVPDPADFYSFFWRTRLFR